MRTVAITLGLLVAAAAPAAAVQLEPVADGLTGPTYVTGAPGDDTRLYVTEKDGLIKVVRDGVVQPEPFLDVTDRLDPASEGGLMSMAFPPDHRRTGLFYVFLAVHAPPGFPGNDILVEERRLDACSPDRADPEYVRTVVSVLARQRDNHNGGQLQWGPDGNLWFSVGDGGGHYDVEGDAQNTANGMGKIHRVRPTPGGGHTIPAGNPFAGSSIWAYGLRNPWRFSFDRSTGDLWIGDVGQGGVEPGTGIDRDNIEEVDVLRAADGRSPGANLGWRRFEGDRDYGSGPPPADYVAPVITHDAGATGWNSVTGGYVARDPALEWAGQYVYGDFIAGEIRRAASGDPSTDTATPLSVDGLVSFGEDWSGRLYAVSITEGRVWRFTSDTGANGPALPADPAGGCLPAPNAPRSPVGVATPPAESPPIPLAALPRDDSAPRLSVHVPARQRLRRRSLLVRAACDEPCTVTASGKAGRRTIPPVKRRLARGVRASLRVRLGPLAVAALRRTRTASIVVAATDDAGNVTRRTARVTVVR